MDSAFYEVYYDVEKAIDLAFRGQFVLKFYDYLKIRGTKKYEIEQFLKTPIVNEIDDLIKDLDDYLEGGSDEMHKQLREAYGYISKPNARKIKDYLFSILNDAQKYSYDKRPGRKKKTK